MRKLKNFSKSIILLLLALSLLCQPLFSQEEIKYEITEAELITLETTIQQSKMELTLAENKLEIAENTLIMQDRILTMQNQLLDEYEKEEKSKNIKMGITIGVVSFTIGALAVGIPLIIYNCTK